MANYTRKLEQLKSRRQDSLTKAFSVNESFNRRQYGESTTYALEAMEPIKEEYTKNTYKACERVQEQLKQALPQYGIGVDFRYQGSVPTNTHIKNYSDIDLLTLHQRFYSLQPPQQPAVPYTGDWLEDLKELRRKTFRILDAVFTACEIDDTGSKCITISGGSLNRKIDIIASNWYNSLDYAKFPNEANRGVEILDRDRNQTILNYPFLHIYWINAKDERVNGNEKRMIRLLKSLKADADAAVNVSSYDITSLVYRMDDSSLLVGGSQRLTLLQNTNAFFSKLINDPSFRNDLYVANNTRKIFCPEGCQVEELAKLQRELQDLNNAIVGEARPFYSNLEALNVTY